LLSIFGVSQAVRPMTEGNRPKIARGTVVRCGSAIKFEQDDTHADDTVCVP
jgi:hypothetical protein